jgi:hypothetical protein
MSRGLRECCAGAQKVPAGPLKTFRIFEMDRENFGDTGPPWK